MVATDKSSVLDGRVPRRATQVRPQAPTAFELKEGQLLQITDVQGKQVADFVAFNAHDLDELLSTSHTRGGNNSIMLVRDMPIYSNRHNPLLILIEDTVGRHDMLLPACDAQRYREDYGIEDHLNCHDNFAQVLAPWSIPADHLPDPIHFFMNVGFKARGQFDIREPISERNDYVLLRALTDLVIAVSACPQDQNPTNAFKPTDILVRVYQ